MEIEPATVEDVDAVVDQWIALAAEQRDHGSRLLAEANRATIRNAITRAAVADELLVARTDGDALAGFVMFDRELGVYETDVDRGIVRNLYVAPEYRDAGLGTSLLERAEAELADAGVDVVAVEAMADNEAARRFYRRRGFEPHRVRLEKRLRDENHSKDHR